MLGWNRFHDSSRSQKPDDEGNWADGDEGAQRKEDLVEDVGHSQGRRSLVGTHVHVDMEELEEFLHIQPPTTTKNESNVDACKGINLHEEWCSSFMKKLIHLYYVHVELIGEKIQITQLSYVQSSRDLL